MPPSKLDRISPTHYRIICECGKFVHEIQRKDDGSLAYNWFATSAGPEESKEMKSGKKPKDIFDELEG